MRLTLSLGLLALSPLRAEELPERVDNSLSASFPPIIRQTHESCAQEVGLSTMMTYAWNRAQGTPANDPRQQFAGRFLWNFLNRGENRGAEVAEGWELARAMGVPRSDSYSAQRLALGEWPSGYALYREAMKHRVRAYTFLPLTTTTELTAIKKHLSEGRLLAIEGRLAGLQQITIPEGQFESGKQLVTRWGSEGKGHVMTYVGYDERVGHDVNGDGKLTNDLDLDKDGKITLADHELGAFLAVNSYGTDWGDQGKTYVLFRESAVTTFQRGRWAGMMEVAPVYQPLLTLKLTLQSTYQTALRIQIKASSGETHIPLLFDGAPSYKPTRKDSPEKHSRFVTGKRRLANAPLRTDPQKRLKPVEIGLDLTGHLPLNAESYALTHWHALDHPTVAGTLLKADLRRYDPQGNLISEVGFPDFPRPIGSLQETNESSKTVSVSPLP